MTRNPSAPGSEAFSALDPAARTLIAGDLRAVFCRAAGCSAHRCATAARSCSAAWRISKAPSGWARPAASPIHPWANRLDGLRYAAASREVALDAASPLLHFDRNGLPSHGVSWTDLAWEVNEDRPDTLTAGLDWRRDDLLAILPVSASAAADRDNPASQSHIATTLIAGRFHCVTSDEACN